MVWVGMNVESGSETGPTVAARGAGLVEVLDGAGGKAGEDDEEECGDHGGVWIGMGGLVLRGAGFSFLQSVGGRSLHGGGR